MKNRQINAYQITTCAMMAAMVYVVTLFRFPFLGSMIHLANAVCLLSGIFLGPWLGGLSAGLGSALYDAFTGYDTVGVLITFVSKFLMAFVCATIFFRAHARRGKADRTVLACVLGALTYVALYMLKTFVFQRFVYGYPMETTWATMGSKLIPSLINALAAVIAAPLFYHALAPALKAAGLLHRMQPQR